MRHYYKNEAELKAYEQGRQDANAQMLDGFFDFALSVLGLWRPAPESLVVDKLWLGKTDVTDLAVSAVVSRAPGRWSLGAVKFLLMFDDNFAGVDAHGNIMVYWKFGLVKWMAKE